MRGLRALRESVRRQRHKNSAVILRALQGDVFDARLVDGTNTGIRLLGIDAPDIIRPENDIECYSNISRSAASSFLVKKRVELEKSSDYQRDSFGRLVRYVRFGSQDASAWMIWNGFAFADREHEHRRQSRYLSLELSAREAKRGLWSHKCEYNKLIDVFPIQ